MELSAPISLAAETVAKIGGLNVTNALLTSWIVVAVLAAGALLAARAYRTVPRGAQNIIEMIMEALLSLMDAVTGDRKKSEEIFPLVASLFFFIIAVNWIGLLPGVGSVGLWETHGGEKVLVPLFRGGNADLNSTLALAVIAVVSTHAYALKKIGFKLHIQKYLNFKNPILFFVGILEAVSELAKVISFSFRLFGNVFAGEVLLIVVGVIAPFVAPIPFLGLELFVGFIQALVFAVLTLVFATIAGEAHQEAH